MTHIGEQRCQGQSAFQGQGGAHGIIDDVTKSKSVLIAFEGTWKQTLRTLKFCIVAEPFSLMIFFHYLDALSQHNVILGRNWIHTMKAIPSTYHKMI